MKRFYAILTAVIATAVVLCLSLVMIIRDNKRIEVTYHTVSASALPSEFNGFTIAQISDLHDATFGEGNETLLRLLSEAAPDIIAVTGDIGDSNRAEIEDALELIPELVKIAPCYFVAGNHEAGFSEENYGKLMQCMNDAGVSVLNDEYTYITRGSAGIVLAGLQDPYFVSEHRVFGTDGFGVIRQKLAALELPEDAFTVLLSHRPEAFELYVESGVDLALTGHTHGGQVRLPWIGGLIAPHQGLFPKYDAGMYEKNSTRMYVNRGLGNSRVPLRINDRPEIAVFRLTNQSEAKG